MFPILLRARDFIENYMKATEQFMFLLKHFTTLHHNTLSTKLSLFYLLSLVQVNCNITFHNKH